MAQPCIRQPGEKPRPETPPRYRYVRSGTSDDEEAHCDSTSNKVLAARKRAGSLGRPVMISRKLDRQRHGGASEVSAEVPPAPQPVLQAPALLKLGHIDAPFLLDAFRRREQGRPPAKHLFGMNFAHAGYPFCLARDLIPVQAVPVPAMGQACMGSAKPPFQRSQSAGRNAPRESAFLRPWTSTRLENLLAPAPNSAPLLPCGHAWGTQQMQREAGSCSLPPSNSFTLGGQWTSAALASNLADAHQWVDDDLQRCTQQVHPLQPQTLQPPHELQRNEQPATTSQLQPASHITQRQPLRQQKDTSQQHLTFQQQSQPSASKLFDPPKRAGLPRCT